MQPPDRPRGARKCFLVTHQTRLTITTLISTGECHGARPELNSSVGFFDPFRLQTQRVRSHAKDSPETGRGACMVDPTDFWPENGEGNVHRFPKIEMPLLEVEMVEISSVIVSYW